MFNGTVGWNVEHGSITNGLERIGSIGWMTILTKYQFLVPSWSWARIFKRTYIWKLNAIVDGFPLKLTLQSIVCFKKNVVSEVFSVQRCRPRSDVNLEYGQLIYTPLVGLTPFKDLATCANCAFYHTYECFLKNWRLCSLYTRQKIPMHGSMLTVHCHQSTDLFPEHCCQVPVRFYVQF